MVWRIHNTRKHLYRKESGLEIDFITSLNAEPALIEVKATTGNTKSSNTILKNKSQYGVNLCVKLSSNNVGLDGEKFTIPYYMAYMLDDRIDI